MKSRKVFLSAAWSVLGLVAFVPWASPAAAASDTRVRFAISGPFRVGARGFDAGVIAFHSISPFTPTTAILEVWVNGECLGLMKAHRTVSEEAAARTAALFHRDDDGRLEMIGFQVTGGAKGTTYRFP